jgi:hypothetical protein
VACQRDRDIATQTNVRVNRWFTSVCHNEKAGGVVPPAFTERREDQMTNLLLLLLILVILGLKVKIIIGM